MAAKRIKVNMGRNFMRIKLKQEKGLKKEGTVSPVSGILSPELSFLNIRGVCHLSTPGIAAKV